MQNKLHLPSLMSQMQQDSWNLKAGIEYLAYERESLETAIMRLEAETEHFSMDQEIETNEQDGSPRLSDSTDPDRDEINIVDGCNTSGHESFQSNSRDHQESVIAKHLTALGFDAKNLHTFRPESIHVIYHALLSGYRRSNLATFADQEEPGCFFCLEETAIGNWAVAVSQRHHLSQLLSQLSPADDTFVRRRLSHRQGGGLCSITGSTRCGQRIIS